MKVGELLKEDYDDLEQYRQHALQVLQQHQPQLKNIAESVLQTDVADVQPIGSVTDPDRFNEQSDIDVGFYLTPNSDHVNELLSEKLQQQMIKYPLGDLGVVNTVVFE